MSENVNADEPDAPPCVPRWLVAPRAGTKPFSASRTPQNPISARARELYTFPRSSHRARENFGLTEVFYLIIITDTPSRLKP